jgi:hypothetical protein
MLLELKVRIEIDVEENVVTQYGWNAHMNIAIDFLMKPILSFCNYCYSWYLCA